MLKKAATLTLAFLVLTAIGSWTQAGADESADKVLRILRTTNKAQVNSFVAKVYDLENVNPYAVVRFITRVMQAEEGSFFSFASPDGNSGKILAICPQHQIPGLDELIQTIDRPNLTSSSGEVRVYQKMKHRSVADAGFLDTIISYGSYNGFRLYSDPQTNALLLVDIPEAIPSILAVLDEAYDIPTKEVAIDVTVYEVDVSDDKALGLDFHAWKNGPGRNLFALGGFTQFEKISNLTNIISPGKTDVNYGLGNNQPLFDSGSNITGLPGNRMNAHGYNVAWNYHVPSAYFDALTVKGQAKIVTKTRLTILNNHQGSISTGEQYLYYQGETASQIGELDYGPGGAAAGGVRPANLPLDPLGENYLYPDNRTVLGKVGNYNVSGGTLSGQIYDRRRGEAVTVNNVIAAAESGIFLDVIPRIGEDDITLDVAYSVVNMTGFDGEGVPMLASRSNVSTVHAADGEEIVLGGLVREAEVRSTRKVPFLGSLPVLGYWFGGEMAMGKRTQVVVIMKPTIVKNFNNLTAEDEELLAKVQGDAKAPMQDDEYGWDMYLIDREDRQ